MRRNFEWRVEIRTNNAFLWDIPTGHTDSLKFAYLISNKNNVFNVMNSLVLFTVLNRTYEFHLAEDAAVVSSLSDVLQYLSLAVRSEKTHLSISTVPP